MEKWQLLGQIDSVYYRENGSANNAMLAGVVNFLYQCILHSILILKQIQILL
ncbi:MAG: hypothetical protein ACFFDF_24835 [Candidatus Odinarchaeota archaeon]